ncbi:hypothetical protein C7271_26725 [filamentous cyanobacterium CCP5]|nr:hypothetical protein C7271_26725 [filamentous cyanobacterium CCP5]
METIFPRSLRSTVAATTGAIAVLVISATLAESFNLISTSRSDDDRGSGRVSQADDILSPALLSLRGSGRLGSDPEQSSAHSHGEVGGYLSWRGSGRVDENPNVLAVQATLRA